MRKTNKLIAFMLTFIVAASFFAACTKENTEKEAVRKTVEGYLSATKDSDSEKVMSYIHKDSDLYKKTEEELGDAAYLAWGKTMVQVNYMSEDYAKDVAYAYEKMMKNLAQKQEIKIDNVEISEDKKSATVKCSGKAYDDKALATMISQETFDEIKKEMYGKKVIDDDEELYSVFEEQYKRAAENVGTKDIQKTIKLNFINNEWKIVESN